MIEFHCSRCGKKLKVADDAAGKRGKCPLCSAALDVPGLDAVIPFAETPSISPTPTPAAAVRAPHSAPPAAVFMLKGIPCNTCNAGMLVGRKKYRMSAAVVVIGYILLIPSVIGILVSALMCFSTGGSTATTLDRLKAETQEKLSKAGVPSGVASRVLASQHLSEADLSTLTAEQRRVAESAETMMSAGAVGVGGVAALVGGTSLCFGISAFVGGLLGWLLVMKKKVLQCNNCGAVVAAS